MQWKDWIQNFQRRFQKATFCSVEAILAAAQVENMLPLLYHTQALKQFWPLPLLEYFTEMLSMVDIYCLWKLKNPLWRELMIKMSLRSTPPRIRSLICPRTMSLTT